MRPDEQTVTAVHEAAHAAAFLHFGDLPACIEMHGDGGSVTGGGKRLTPAEDLIVSAAGDYACHSLLGVEDTMSDGDRALGLAGWKDLRAGMPNNMAARRHLDWHVGELVFQLTPQILEIANELLKAAARSRNGKVKYSGDDLAALVHSRPVLGRFRGAVPLRRRSAAVMRRHAPSLVAADTAAHGLTRAALVASGVDPETAALISSR